MQLLSLGFYGKMPARGDFVQNNVSTDFVAPWDAWLQELVQNGQSIMGDNWQTAYLQMPIWHFALAPGVCGADACLGVLVTSVDSAGRCFPLTLLVTCRQDSIDPESAVYGLPLLVFDRVDIAYALEDLALSALQPGAQFEDFKAQVESLALPAKCRVLTSQADVDNSTSMVQSVVRAGLLAKCENWSGRSLWWAQFGNRTVFSHEVGLPSPIHFATMILGMENDANVLKPEAMLLQQEYSAELLSSGVVASTDTVITPESAEKEAAV
jgi:type VI secretion system protein ImpM